MFKTSLFFCLSFIFLFCVFLCETNFEKNNAIFRPISFIQKNKIKSQQPFDEISADINKEKIKLVTPHDSDYPNWVKPYNKLMSSDIRPLAITFPKNAEEISKIIKLCNIKGLKVTARSGGHSFTGQSISNGVIIDFYYMRQIKVDENNKTAWVEPGMRLSELTNALNKKDFVFPVGSCGDVGISGYILGGGLGFLGRKFGLGCQQILDAEIILADGKSALASQHPDLLLGLKGAGHCNFAIISKFLIKIYSAPKYNYLFSLEIKDKVVLNSMQRFKEIMRKWQQFNSDLIKDISTSIILAKDQIIVSGQYSSDNDIDLKSILSSIYENISIQKFENYRDILTGLSQIYHFHTSRNDPRFKEQYTFNTLSSYSYENILPEEAIEILFDYYFRAPKFERSYYSCVIELMNSDVIKSSLVDTSFVHGAAKYQIQHSTYLGKDKSIAFDRQMNMYNKLKPFMSEGTYVNYPSLLLNNNLKTNYGNKLGFLISLKKKYDPQGLFYQNQGIPVYK
jgi:hypothetical protein